MEVLEKELKDLLKEQKSLPNHHYFLKGWLLGFFSLTLFYQKSLYPSAIKLFIRNNKKKAIFIPILSGILFDISNDTPERQKLDEKTNELLDKFYKELEEEEKKKLNLKTDNLI